MERNFEPHVLEQIQKNIEEIEVDRDIFTKDEVLKKVLKVCKVSKEDFYKVITLYNEMILDYIMDNPIAISLPECGYIYVGKHKKPNLSRRMTRKYAENFYFQIFLDNDNKDFYIYRFIPIQRITKELTERAVNENDTNFINRKFTNGSKSNL